MTVETVLRDLRLKKDWTLDDAARAVGLSISGYQQIEIGSRSADVETATKIAEQFAVPLGAIFVPRSFTAREIGGAVDGTQA